MIISNLRSRQMLYGFASKEYLGIGLGDRKQTKNPTADNHSGKGKHPQSFVVNQLRPIMVFVTEVPGCHDCLHSNGVRCPPAIAFFKPLANLRSEPRPVQSLSRGPASVREVSDTFRSHTSREAAHRSYVAKNGTDQLLAIVVCSSSLINVRH